jgi:hypothetical protein
MFAFYVVFAVLVLVLLLLTRVRDNRVEFFVAEGPPQMSLEGMPTPPELFKRARDLLAKYDQPDLWIHAARVMDKDPGQLARMNLGSENSN